MGKKVALPAAVDKVFVWSQSDNEFTPSTRSAFYVNTEKGFLLNKTSGNADLDIDGALRIA